MDGESDSFRMSGLRPRGAMVQEARVQFNVQTPFDHIYGEGRNYP